MPNKKTICYLCGELIDKNSTDQDLKLSMDHTPPKQFYPKELRKQQDLNLELVPSHKKCNESFREDEEYFYHSLYPMVADANPKMGRVIFRDFQRRSQKPQTPAMIRNITKTAAKITEGGIHLPLGKVALNLDEGRLQNIAIKIARGVMCLNGITYLPAFNCFDIRMAQNESEVIELYRLTWQASPEPQGNYHKVFSYRHCCFDNCYYVTLLFWESIMYCLGFRG